MLVFITASAPVARMMRRAALWLVATLLGCGAEAVVTREPVETGGVVVASAASEPPVAKPAEPVPIPAPAVASADPVFDVAEPGEDPPPARLSKGSVAPAFDLVRVGHAGRIALSKQRGKVVILHFFATWVEPSKKALARFAEVSKELGADKVVLMAVSVDDPEGASSLRRYVQDLPRVTLVVHDTTGSVVEAYAPPQMPTTYVIDRDGVVRLLQAGFSEEAVAPLRAEVAALVRKR